MTDRDALLATLERDYRRITGAGRSLRLTDRIEEDLGLDSLAAMDLLSTLEDRHGVDLIGDARTRRLRTVGDLLDVLTDLADHRGGAGVPAGGDADPLPPSR